MAYINALAVKIHDEKLIIKLTDIPVSDIGIGIIIGFHDDPSTPYFDADLANDDLVIKKIAVDIVSKEYINVCITSYDQIYEKEEDAKTHYMTFTGTFSIWWE